MIQSLQSSHKRLNKQSLPPACISDLTCYQHLSSNYHTPKYIISLSPSVILFGLFGASHPTTRSYRLPPMDMDNFLGGGGGGGAMGQFPLEQWFYEMPVCTRWWTVATVATSLLVQCHIITPFQLFYSFRAVFVKNQVFDVALFPPSKKI